MSQSTFSVNRFENRNGVISWRVDGRLNGVRIRRNFKTQEEATAEKSSLELKALQIAKELREVATELTADQVRDAETAFRRIGDRPHPLLFYVEFALANYREPTMQKSLVAAAAAFVASKEHEREQDLISEPYLVRLRREMTRLPKRCPVKLVSDLTPGRMIKYFEFGRTSRKTYNNRRGTMSAFLKFALHREWITENPLLRIPAHRIRRKRGGAATLTAANAKALMEFVETTMPEAVPFSRSACLLASVHACAPVKSSDSSRRMCGSRKESFASTAKCRKCANRVKSRFNRISLRGSVPTRWRNSRSFRLTSSICVEKPSRSSTFRTTSCGIRSFRCSWRNSAPLAKRLCRRAIPKASSASTTSKTAAPPSPALSAAA